MTLNNNNANSKVAFLASWIYDQITLCSLYVFIKKQQSNMIKSDSSVIRGEVPEYEHLKENSDQ